MRKSRGKRVDNGEWVKGYYCQIEDGHYIVLSNAKHKCCLCTGFCCASGFVEVIPETVGQSTGLKDKNGKEIWEGDIIRIKDKYPIRKIMYCPNEGAFVASDIKYQAYILLAGIADVYDSEVIGDVHSNPELLEEK